MGKRTVGKFLVSMNCGTVCLFVWQRIYGKQWLRLGVPQNLPLIFFSRNNLIYSVRQKKENSGKGVVAQADVHPAPGTHVLREWDSAPQKWRRKCYMNLWLHEDVCYLLMF